MKKKKVLILSVLMLVLVATGVLGAFLMFKNEEVEVEPTGNKANVEWYTEDGDEFVISTEEELYGLVKLSKYYDFSGQTIKLGADIVINDGNAKDWVKKTPAKRWYPIDGFSGTFDGQGHSISGVYAYGADTAMGLFANTKMNCVIKNLKVLNSYFEVDGTESVGSIASNGCGTFEKLYSDAIVTCNGLNAGGLVGKINADGTVTVTAKTSKMTNCWFDGSVIMTTKTGRYAGGLIGCISGGSLTISHCLNSGDVSSESKETNGLYIGGIFGVMTYTNFTGSVTIEDTLNVGKISVNTTTATGSLAGGTVTNTTMTIKDTYVTEESYSAVCTTQQSATTGSAMMINTDFVRGENWYSWTTLNYDEYWTVTKDDTPILRSYAEEVIDTTNLKKAYNVDWYNQYAKESIIDSVEDLYGFAIMSYFDNFTGKFIKLGANITVNEGKAAAWASGKTIPEKTWAPISRIYHFQGVFDGQGHTISGLYCKSPNDFVGLFGCLGTSGEVKNVKVVNSYFEASGALGSIVARCEGKIDTAYSDAYLTENAHLGGGIAGYKLTDNVSKITNCWYDGVLTVEDTARLCGGIMGRLLKGTIEMEACLFTGKIVIDGELRTANIGGFLGNAAAGTVSVKNSLNSGEIVLSDAEKINAVGRVFGQVANEENISISVEDSYFTCEGYSPDYYYYCAGNKPKVKGCAELKRVEDILGYNGYRTTSLDFSKYWTVVVGEDSTPILKSFAKKVPSVAGLEKTFDKSWYSHDKDNFVLKDAKDFYGFLYLSNSKNDFKGKTITLANDIQLNAGLATEWADGKNLPDNIYAWSGIGKYANFQGTFDGQGHTVSGLYGKANDYYLGLFGYVGTEGTVKNVRLTNSYLVMQEQGSAVGSIVGRLEGNVHTTYSEAIIRTSGKLNGGIAGYKLLQNTKSKIVNSWYAGTIYMDGDDSGHTGGLVGRLLNGEMELNSCLFSGKIVIGGKLRTANVGGFMGSVATGVLSVKHSLNSGEFAVSDAEKINAVGRVFGQVSNDENISITVEDSYFTSEGYSPDYYYYCAGNKPTIKGCAELKRVEEILGYNGYCTTSLDFFKYWTIVVNEDGTPILKSFAKEVPSVAGLKKTFDKSWYSQDKKRLVLKDAEDLYGFLYLSNSKIDFKDKTIVLKNDIALNNGLATDWADGKNLPTNIYNWSGIGKYANFQGTFDGQGHTISGLYGKANDYYLGLFGYVGTEGTIKNVRLTNSYLVIEDKGSAVGSIVGRLEGNVHTAYSDAIIRTPYQLNGGIAGYKITANTKSKIENTWYAGTIYMDGDSAGYTGGIIGRLNAGELEVSNCLFSGKIVIAGKTRSANIGGLVGNNNSTLILKSCLNSGEYEVTEANRMNSTCFIVGQIVDDERVKLVMENVYTINNGEAKERINYYCSGNKPTIEGHAENKRTNDILGYDGYRTTSLDFAKYWAVVVNEDSTPILKSFAKKAPSVAGLKKTFDKSWYNQNKKRFVLKDAEDLYGFLYLSNSEIDFKDKTVVLKNDITLNDGKATDWAEGKNLPEKAYHWSGIGAFTTFLGTFDGQGNTISGLYCNLSGGMAGLFSRTSANSIVQDFSLSNSYVGGGEGYYNGSVVGRVGGTIRDVKSDAIVRGTKHINGGIAGGISAIDSDVKIINCKFTGSVEGKNFTGGIVGAFGNTNLEVKNCEVTNQVIGSGESVGGILGGVYAGNASKTYNIEKCQFTGELEGTGDYVGGIVGLTHTGTTYLKGNYFGGSLQVAYGSGGGIVGCAYGTTDIENCNSSTTASISNTATADWGHAGGCVGRIKGTVSIRNSSFAGMLNGVQNVGGLVGYVDSTTKATIENSYFAGTLNATSHYVGGILGRIDTICEIDITNCYSSGSVTSEGMNVGGIIGIINQAADVDMVNCLNKGTVSSSRDSVGGLVGRLASYSGINLDMRSCLNMGRVSGAKNVGSLIGWIQKGTVTAKDVYATKTSKATGGTDNIVVGSDANLAYAEMVELEEITISDTVSVDDIRTTLSGLFGTDTMWTIKNIRGRTPELKLVVFRSLDDDLINERTIVDGIFSASNLKYANFAEVNTTNSNVTNVTPEGADFLVEKHEDIRAYRTKNQDGYYIIPNIVSAETSGAWVFAGWYANANCTDTLKESQTNGEGYAKFVSSDVLSVQYQISVDTTSTSASTLLRFISSVDTLKYNTVGFELVTLDGVKNMESGIVGTRIQAPDDNVNNQCNYSPKVVDAESEYFYSAVEEIVKNDFDKGFLIKPYWITKDGTKVYGVSRYIIVNEVIDKNSIYIPVKMDDETATVTNSVTVGGETATQVVYDADGGYAHYKLNVSSLPSVTKHIVKFGSTEQVYFHRNLNTKYVGDNADTSWYTAYADSTEDEFVIATSADLYGLSVLANATNKNTFEGKTIHLCADVEVNKGEATLEGWKATGEDGTSHTWTPIGTLNVSFNGTFDGQGHTISGIKVEDGYVAGLFAHAGANSVLQNFNLVNSYIGGTKYNGSVVGRVGGRISNVESSAIVQCSSYINGGIAGDTGDVDQTIVIEDCKFTGSIKSANLTGGIIGAFGKSNLKVKNCEVTNRIESSGQSVGGILGGVYEGNASKTYSIENCRFTGELTAQGDYVGGIVGLTNTGISNLKDNYFDGKLQVPSGSVGGIVGCAYGTTDIDNCNSSTTASISNTASAGETGGCVGRIKGTVGIRNSSFAGILNGAQNVGGLAGYVDSTTKITIENSYFAGTLNATSHYVGGILGMINTACEIDITSCYSSGTVTSSGMNIGGIIGIINQAADIDMVNCLNKGTVSSSRDSVGGLVGRLASYSGINLDMRSCLNMGRVSGANNVGTLIGWIQKGTVDVETVYATKTSKATAGTDNIVVGSDATLAYAELVELEDITVSDTVSVDDIKTTLSGLFGADTRWMIDNKVGSTPELRLK